MAFTRLATYDNTITANILRTKLESEGITCMLTNEHFTNLMPFYFQMLGSGVQVLVPKDQLEKAREIAGLQSEQLTCPNCGSADLANEIDRFSFKMILGMMGLVFGIPIGNQLNNYTCKQCRRKFKG